LLVAVALVLITTSIASAHGSVNPGVLPPNSSVQELTYFSSRRLALGSIRFTRTACILILILQPIGPLTSWSRVNEDDD
jgi:hypothetical protein